MTKSRGRFAYTALDDNAINFTTHFIYAFVYFLYIFNPDLTLTIKYFYKAFLRFIHKI